MGEIKGVDTLSFQGFGQPDGVVHAREGTYLNGVAHTLQLALYVWWRLSTGGRLGDGVTGWKSDADLGRTTRCNEHCQQKGRQDEAERAFHPGFAFRLVHQ